LTAKGLNRLGVAFGRIVVELVPEVFLSHVWAFEQESLVVPIDLVDLARVAACGVGELREDLDVGIGRLKLGVGRESGDKRRERF
jgi:hypothetical protein